MLWITVVDWPGGRIADFDREHADHGGDPPGIVARYCGTVGGSLRIVAAWESKDAADRFFAAMPADVKARLAPKTNGVPATTAFAAERTFDRTPVA